MRYRWGFSPNYGTTYRWIIFIGGMKEFRTSFNPFVAFYVCEDLKLFFT